MKDLPERISRKAVAAAIEIVVDYVKALDGKASSLRTEDEILSVVT
jgi:hypothetical protein